MITPRKKPRSQAAAEGWKRRLETKLVGRRFGKLLVQKRASKEEEISRDRSPHWHCLCDCGKEKICRGSFLAAGTTRSCGCLVGIKNLHDLAGKKFHQLTVESRAKNIRGKPAWNCICTCGKTKTVKASFLTNGGVKSCGCLLKRIGPDHPSWKGGRQIIDGYVVVADYSTGKKRIMKEHRLIMEKKLGRPLFKNENVHHKNGIRSDNRIKNLELWVKTQPCGQRVEDLIEFSLKILQRYDPGRLHH